MFYAWGALSLPGRVRHADIIPIVAGQGMSETELHTTSRLVGRAGWVPDPTSSTSTQPDPIAALGQLAQYRILRRLGCGGMGAVYLAFDEGLDRQVALKVMLPEAAADPAAKERFIREARAAAAVRNDHVVTIYQVGEDEGIPFIAMEFLTGYPLDHYLARKGRLTVPQALRIGVEASEGLAAAHALGLIHRDIKPANLWLESPRGRVKILDFGIARRLGDGPQAGLTGTGIVIGTPGYMSPEQARGKALDPRSDLFSLGVLLYQLTTGRMPFEGDSTLAVLTALATEAPLPVQTQNTDIPGGFAALIHRLLEKHPDARPASACAVAEELRALAAGREVPVAIPVVVAPAEVPESHPSSEFEGLGDGSTDAEPVSERTRSGRTPQPRGVSVWVAVGAVLGLVGLVVGIVLAFRNPTPAKAPDAPDTKPAAINAKPTAPRPATPKTTTNPSPNPTPNFPPPNDGTPPNFDSMMLRYLHNSPDQPVTEEEVNQLRAVRGLVALDVGGLDDAGFERLSQLPLAAGIIELRVLAPQLTDVGFVHVTRFQNLRSLTIGRAPDPMLQPLLGGSRITDDGVKPLVELPRLVSLSLPGSRVTDKAVSHFAALKFLASLDLEGTAFGDDGLKGLTDVAGLTRLNLRNTPVTDAGLEHLRGRKFQLIDLRGTKTTAAELRKLADSLPMGGVVAGDSMKP